MQKASSPSWSDIKKHLTRFDQPALIGLMQDLFKLSASNREFLAARFLAADDEDAIRARYRERIAKYIYPNRTVPQMPKFKEARAVISEYRKARGDVAGMVDLMLTYLEYGTAFTNDYGDMEEPFYNSLGSILGEVVKALRTVEGAAVYGEFKDRLDKLSRDSRDIGYGYGDDVSYEIDQLAAEMEEAEPDD
jgi:hypothetical protein